MRWMQPSSLLLSSRPSSPLLFLFLSYNNYILVSGTSFSTAVNEEVKALEKGKWDTIKPPHVQAGIYYYQIEKYYNLFPRENILILEHEELNRKHDETVQVICDFLKIPNEKLAQLKLNVSVKENKNEYSEQLERLSDFYKPYNEKLFDLIGKRYHW